MWLQCLARRKDKGPQVGVRLMGNVEDQGARGDCEGPGAWDSHDALSGMTRTRKREPGSDSLPVGALLQS